MVKKKGMPHIGEFVLIRIKNINPNSAFASLDEYDKEGMIHISEVKHGWVRDIRKYLKVGQSFVAKVVAIREDRIQLSIKRVDDRQKNDKIKEYKLEQKAEKMLGFAAKEMGKKTEDAYNEIGYKLQESFGTLFAAFKMLLKNPEKVEKLVSKEWYTVLKDVAEKNIEQKVFEFKANVTMSSLDPKGLDLIKNALKKVKKMDLEVKYISAPKYAIKYKTKDAKKGKREFSKKLENIKNIDKKIKASVEVIDK